MKDHAEKERIVETAVCRMVEGPSGVYRVEIFGPANELLAMSPSGLNMKSALAFVDQVVGERFNTYYSWEEGPSTLPMASTPLLAHSGLQVLPNLSPQ